ncbi:hypothetical protein OAN24_05400 [Pseudodesulfovibrio sp.]|nr:hypothetical protein [Pseudodesulfovibrio sp.]
MALSAQTQGISRGALRFARSIHTWIYMALSVSNDCDLCIVPWWLDAGRRYALTWEWVDESNVIAVEVGRIIVHSADKLHSMMNDFCLNVSTILPMETIDGEAWLLFYRSRKKLFESIIDEVQAANSAMMETHITPEVEFAFKKNKSILQGDLEERSKRMISLVFSGEYKSLESFSLGMRFFVQVMIPCWVLYGEMPGMLYRKACCGDLDSFIKLLKLDRVLVGDKRFSKRIAATGLNQNSDTYRRILRAMGHQPSPIKIKWLKMLLAALILRISQVCGCRLSYMKVRQIFDDCANDMGQGLIDVDLQEGEEAFEKAVRRNLGFWKCF